MGNVTTPATWDEVRKWAIEETPEQWCPTLSILEGQMAKHGFDSLRDLITTPYSKGGLGIPLDKAIQFIEFNPAYEHQAMEFKKKLGVAEFAKEVEVLGEHGHNQVGHDKTKNIMSSQGTGSKYRIAKLKRDHPDIAQRLMDGEFKSVSAAEREAGIGKPLLTPVEKIIRLYDKLSPQDKLTLERYQMDSYLN